MTKPGCRAARLPGFGDPAFLDRREAIANGFPLERGLSANRFVESGTEAELIRSRIDALPLELLGRHVRRRSHEGPGSGHPDRQAAGASGYIVRYYLVLGGQRTSRSIRAARQTEVEHADAAVFCDQHIVGLEVPVHDPGAVRCRNPLSREHEDAKDFTPVPLLGAQPLPKGGPLHVLHRNEDFFVEGAHVMDRDHIRMRQSGQSLRFPQQARFSVAPRGVQPCFGSQHLDCQLAIQFGIIGGVNDAHSAGADDVEDHVAAERGSSGEGHVVRERSARVLRVRWRLARTGYRRPLELGAIAPDHGARRGFQERPDLVLSRQQPLSRLAQLVIVPALRFEKRRAFPMLAFESGFQELIQFLPSLRRHRAALPR